MKRKGRPAATELSPKQWKFIQEYLRTGKAEASAAAAGYSHDYSSELLNHPLIRHELDRARAEFRAKSQFGMEQAFEEANIAIQFAKDTGSAMALVNATKHKAELAGFMIERVAEVKVDLHQVLVEAKRNRNPELEAKVMEVLAQFKPTQANPTAQAKLEEENVLQSKEMEDIFDGND